MFDGVHLGHQQVLRQTVEDARQHDAVSVAVTFDRHPNAVVAPERNPPLIYNLEQKLRAISSLEIDTTLLIHFDQSFSQQSGADFVQGLAADFGSIHSISVGNAFTFGCKRSGDVSLLRRLGQQLGFVVHGVAAVSLDDKVVSSTRIRDSIRAGDLDAAGQMLGRGYALTGRVIRGDQQGRQLGFPTANVDCENLVVPPNGVYAAIAIIGGRRFHAVVNIGVRPTMNRPTASLQVEAHLLDFEDDLYQQVVELAFIERFREEISFGSREQLRAQIARDIERARSLF
jgi:riboflavin kinase/FMN adenylyltransferase